MDFIKEITYKITKNLIFFYKTILSNILKEKTLGYEIIKKYIQKIFKKFFCRKFVTIIFEKKIYEKIW